MASAMPKTRIKADEVNGSHRVVSRLLTWNRDMKWRAETIKRPIVIRTAASPTLNATIKSNPKPIRCIETALRSTTSAAGQGTIPPLIPNVKSSRKETCRSTL